MPADEPEASRPRRAWSEEPAEPTTGPADEGATPDDPATSADSATSAGSAKADESATSDESATADEGADRITGADADAPADDSDDTATPDDTDDTDAETTRDQSDAPATAGLVPDDDEDAPRPLYRDEDGADATRVPPAGGDTGNETTILSRARERKLHRGQRDPDETTLLPRAAGGRRVQRRAVEDEFDDDDIETDPRSDRRRLLLMIGAVAVVAVLGLLAGYAIIRTTTQPIAGPGPAGSTEPGTGTASPGGETDSTALVTDAMLLTAAQAERLDSKRTWKVALTQRGTAPDSPHHPACLSSDVTESAPAPQQTVLQLLSSSGSDAPAALHQATAYGTPEEAAQAYAYAARALGDCAMTGAWVQDGTLVGGVGDQAVGVTVQVLDGDTTEYRTVVLARTGRVVDVVDVAKPDKAVTPKRVTQVAGTVVDTQCQAAGGACSDEPEAQDGPPPLGGDQPGFLAAGDLPPVGPDLARWAGTTPGEPDDDLLRGSGCETVNWATVKGEDRSHRTYLLSDSSSRFGLDEVVITTAGDKEATELAEKVRDDWKDCGERQLTATVDKAAEVSGPGAKSVDVRGWATEVTQKADDKTTRYRVGIAAAGPKVTFVFLNPQGDLDLTAEQFETVTLRAGQRATQVN